MRARDLALVGTHERAAADDELAADVEAVDSMRAGEDEAGDRICGAGQLEPVRRPHGEIGALPRLDRADVVPPSTSAPPRVPSRIASRAVIACGPPRPRATSSACLTSLKRWLRSFEAEPSTPSPTRTPASLIADGRDAGPEPQIRRRAVGDARAGLGEAADLGVREVDAVRAPDVAVEPAEAVEVLDGRAAVELLAVRLLLHRLRQVGVQLEAEPARELADSVISRPVTEKGEQGATAI